MHSFKVGDRVSLSKSLVEWGKTGTIAFILDEQSVAVTIDDYAGGHDCRGRVANKAGRWINPAFLEKMEPPEHLKSTAFTLEEINEWSSA